MKKVIALAAIAVLLIAVGAAVASVPSVQAQLEEWLPFAATVAHVPEEGQSESEMPDPVGFDTFEEAMAYLGLDPADYLPPEGDYEDRPLNEPPSDPEPEVEQHCVVLIEPLEEGQTASKTSDPECFDTFSEAINAATGGAVRLAADMNPSEITEDMLSPASETVIGIDYSSSNFQGSTCTWVADNAVGCNTGSSYAEPTMPSGWNDIVSSAISYGGCNHYYHYENTWYGGSVLDCGGECATMGVMDNQTSSEMWTP